MGTNRYAVSMVDWSGRYWAFTGDWAAGIKSGGVDGLVGQVDDAVAEPIGTPGQLVVGQQVGPLRGSLTFLCRAHGGMDAGEVQAALRRAWSPLAARTNVVTVSSPVGNVQARLRLDRGHVAVKEDPSWSDVVLDVEIPAVGDEGLWWTVPHSGQGIVTVTNYGDVFLWVRIRWSGDGGRVILPSGASFILPAVESERVLSLSRSESLAVRDAAGVVDQAVRAQLRGVPPEGVPVGQSRLFTVPAGASVEWQAGVLDPWQ